MKMIPKTYKLSPEYECSPIWIQNDSLIYENVPISKLPIEENLRIKLKQWDDIFQKTYNRNNPLYSGFNSKIESDEFYLKGKELFTMLQAAFGKQVRLEFDDSNWR